MQQGSDQVRHPPTSIELKDLRLSAEEIAAVQRGLTIALTAARREGPRSRTG